MKALATGRTLENLQKKHIYILGMLLLTITVMRPQFAFADLFDMGELSIESEVEDLQYGQQRDEVTHSKNEIAKLSKQKNQLHREIQQNKRKQSRTETTIATLAPRLRKLDLEVRQAEADLANIKDQNEILDQQKQDLSTRVNNKENQVRAQKSEISTTKKQIARTKIDIRNLKSREKIAQRNLDRYKKDLQRLNKTRGQQNKQESQLRKRIANIERQSMQATYR